MINRNMKIILTFLGVIFLLVSCAPIDNPKLSFGKKCLVKDDQVYWSHIWIYDKQDGLKANKEDCNQIVLDK